MGWFSYSIYGGDDTQTLHYDFIRWAKIKVDEDEIGEWLGIRKTTIPKEHIGTPVKNLRLIKKKMPNRKFLSEQDHFDWQMLAALLLDNKIYDNETYQRGIDACEFLAQDHASDFDSPSSRRRVLKNFKKKLESIHFF